MIRNLLAIGIITGFIGTGLVPPTKAHVQTSTLASSLLSQNAVKKVSVSVSKAISSTEGAQVKNTIRSSVDSFALSQIERIEWAMKKKDIRLCKDLADAVRSDTSKKSEKHSAGEYISLCVAVVTKDSARCDKIFSKSDALLHAFCIDELAST